MKKNHPVYRTYMEILRRELICAMGCTEPIALAYCAAAARAALGSLPDRPEQTDGASDENAPCGGKPFAI